MNEYKVAPVSRSSNLNASGHLSRQGGATADVLYDDPVKALIARHEAVTYPFHCRFGIARLVIDEGVFCPTLTQASPLLLKAIDFRARERVLDVFAGSGAFGINSALHGAAVVTVDIAPLAVACTIKNTTLNKVEHLVDSRVGTMETCLSPGDLFDLIVANPPLLPGEPLDGFAAAIFDPQLGATRDFVTSLPRHLAPRGRCYLLTSSVIEQLGYHIDSLCVRVGLSSSVVLKLDMGYEAYSVHRITFDAQQVDTPTLSR